jgi:DNA-binding transcriptional ArsR family regulator
VDPGRAKATEPLSAPQLGLAGTATELRIGELGEVRVALDPAISVLALMTDALGRRRGAPEAWRKPILSALSAQGVRAVLPIAAPSYSVAPDCVTPQNPAREIPVTGQVEWLHDLSDHDLLGDLQSVFGATPPLHWQTVLRRPRNWLHAYAEAMGAVWRCVEPLWEQAQPLLNREVRRVGTAAMRGSLDLVLDGLHPASQFDTGVLRIRDPEPARFDLQGRPLVLVPMLSGLQALICNLERADAVWLAYPLPGMGELLGGPAGPGHGEGAPLESVLGPVRARVLLALEQPLTMTDLVGRASLAPSAMTYHCDRLVAAGLVRREKSGREVRISRTGRGTSLIELFAELA